MLVCAPSYNMCNDSNIVYLITTLNHFFPNLCPLSVYMFFSTCPHSTFLLPLISRPPPTHPLIPYAQNPWRMFGLEPWNSSTSLAVFPRILTNPLNSPRQIRCSTCLQTTPIRSHRAWSYRRARSTLTNSITPSSTSGARLRVGRQHHLRLQHGEHRPRPARVSGDLESAAGKQLHAEPGGEPGSEVRTDSWRLSSFHQQLSSFCRMVNEETYCRRLHSQIMTNDVKNIFRTYQEKVFTS